jgi:uracil-DNA glycosylase
VGEFQLVPTYHPAAALRSGGVVVAEMRADLIRAKQLVGWG